MSVAFMCNVHNIASDAMCSLIFKMFQPALGSRKALIPCVPGSFKAGNVAGAKADNSPSTD